MTVRFGSYWFALRGSSRRRGGGQALLSLSHLAVGLPQSPLQLVDAGLVLLQDVLRLVQELLLSQWSAKAKVSVPKKSFCHLL